MGSRTCHNMFGDVKNRWEGPTGPNSHRLIRICAQINWRGHTIKKTISCHSQRSFAAHVEHRIHELKNIGTWHTLNKMMQKLQGPQPLMWWTWVHVFKCQTSQTIDGWALTKYWLRITRRRASIKLCTWRRRDTKGQVKTIFTPTAVYIELSPDICVVSVNPVWKIRNCFPPIVVLRSGAEMFDIIIWKVTQRSVELTQDQTETSWRWRSLLLHLEPRENHASVLSFVLFMKMIKMNWMNRST